MGITQTPISAPPECDFAYAGGLATCRRCGRQYQSPHGRHRAHCVPQQERLVVDTALPRASKSRPGIPRTDAPSFLEKVKNFAVSSAKHVAAGMPIASDEEILRRHDICQGCEFFKDNSCMKCGCPVIRTKKYISKLSWADQECPVGKWGKETPQQGIDK